MTFVKQGGPEMSNKKARSNKEKQTPPMGAAPEKPNEPSFKPVERIAGKKSTTSFT